MTCEHGQLARQCDYCEKNREITELRQQFEACQEAGLKLANELALARQVIEAAARKFLLAAEDWDACISPQDDEGHSLRKYIEAREALREAIKP